MKSELIRLLLDARLMVDFNGSLMIGILTCLLMQFLSEICILWCTLQEKHKNYSDLYA